MGNTANLALPYPENTDKLSAMATAIQALANAIDGTTGLGTTPAAYTPALTATTTNPSVGTGGAVTGWYAKRGKAAVEFTANVLLGAAGLGGGSGQWKISLPVAAHATKNGNRRDFRVDLFDASAGTSYACVAMLAPAVDPNALFLNYHTAANDALVAFTGAANPPAGLATSDQLTVHGLYVPA